MAEQVVELAPGESKLVSFEAIPHEARTYQISVDGLTGSFAAIAPALIFTCPYDLDTFDTATELMDHIRTVHDLPAPSPTPEEAAFYLWELSAEGIRVRQRSPVYVRIINYGAAAGDYSITATIDGQTSTATGSLTPGLNSWAEFWFTPTRAGTHQITANGFSGSFEVLSLSATITLISLSMPTSAPAGAAIIGSLTYQVSAGEIEWASYAIEDYGGIREIPIPFTPGVHTVEIRSWQPGDGYKYQSIALSGQYGVPYLWTNTFFVTGVYVYLEE